MQLVINMYSTLLNRIWSEALHFCIKVLIWTVVYNITMVAQLNGKRRKDFMYFSAWGFFVDNPNAIVWLCLLFQNRICLYETSFYEMNAE